MRPTTIARRFDRLGPVLLAPSLVLAGCSSIGPGSVARDQFDYGQSISESWKRQTLLNIVKLRYLDPPISLDVGQIVSGYSLETDVSLGGTLQRDGSHSLSMGAAGRYTDRPTITYTPLTGKRYVRSALMPLPPEEVFFLIQSGWPADGVLFSAVSSLNGLKNQETSLTGVTPAAPEFLRVLALLRKIQMTGTIALRIELDLLKQQTTLLTFHTEGITAETLNDVAELRRLLRLDPKAQELRLVFGPTPASDKELAVVTRSSLHIMAMMAAYVEVPPEHIAQGRATPGLGTGGTMRIGCLRTRPADAYAAVRYRDRWFWIDDCDLKTKRAFGLLMMLSTLGDGGQREPLPLITIPAH